MRQVTDSRYSFPMGEMSFIFGMLFSATGITLQVKADLGLSMVAAPAYLFSLKISWISFGVGEYIVQGVLFLICCLWTHRFLIKNLWSFVAAIPYGWILDQMMRLLANVNPELFGEKMGLYLLGSLILASGIALLFRSYLPCQVYEMFVKCIAQYTGKPLDIVKITYDWVSLIASVILSLVFFHKIVGIGIGTVLCTLINAPLISIWGKVFDRLFDFSPAISSFTKYFN